MGQISRAARSVLIFGAGLAFLLILVIMTPRLLPGLTGSSPAPGTVASMAAPTADLTIPPAAQTPEITPTHSRGSIQYTVVEGDNLISIADKFNLQPQTVLWSNYDLLLDNPGLIQPGMTLRIPPVDGLYYRWEFGDTVSIVADRFGADPLAILDWPENPRVEGSPNEPVFAPGTEIFIPGGVRPLQSSSQPMPGEVNTTYLISPDGRLAAVYQAGRPGQLNIEDVQTRRVLFSIIGGVNPGNWSPDSRYLLYWENTLGSASIQADGLPMRVLDVKSGEGKIVATTLTNPIYQSWSPDSTKLAFTNGGYRSAQVNKWLSIFDVATGRVDDIIPKETLVTGMVNWSPDGKWIAVAAVEGSKTGEEYADYMGWDNPAIAARRIYLVDPVTGDFRRLTKSEAYEDAPRWSEDGKRLFFVQADGSQARLMAANLETGEVVAVQDCEMPMPPSAGYYGQADWFDLYDSCPADKLLAPEETETAEEVSPTGLAEFELYFYRPLVVDYDPEVWEDRSEPENTEMMVNYLQHRQLESCTIGVRGPSGFYPEDMQEVTLGDITYQVYEQELSGGAVVRDYFFKSATTEAFEEVFNTVGVSILQVQYHPSERRDCLAAAEEVFATLRPSERLID